MHVDLDSPGDTLAVITGNNANQPLEVYTGLSKDNQLQALVGASGQP